MITINILTNLNLSKNQIQNAVIQPLAVAPSNPKEGQIYYNSSDKFIYRFDGTNWGSIGVVYNQGSSAGAVITGLDSSGNVTTTNVTGLTLSGYSPVSGGYVSEGMTLEQAFVALDTAVKNAVAGGGEVNQNAWSNITVKKQSDTTTAVAGQSADVTLSADTKTDTFTIASGNKWVDINGSGKTINIGHSLSGVTAGTYGNASHVAKVTVDGAGHVTGAELALITPESIGADKKGAADAVLGVSGDTSDKNTVYGVKALANEKVASVGATVNKGIEAAGTTTNPTIGIKLDTTSGNAATLSDKGLMVTIPEVEVPEYTVVKLASATTGYLASYQLQKDGTGIGEVINIPKDYLVKSAEIKTSTGTGDPSGLPSGTKYIDFTINTYDSVSGTGTTSHIYLNVEDLVDVYTAGNGIAISEANVVSVKVVAGNGLSLGANGISMGTASTTANGAMTIAMVTKLNGVDEGATKNTITLNGAANVNPSFYAPTAAGTTGNILVSQGANKTPIWQAMPTTVSKNVVDCPSATLTDSVFNWTINSLGAGKKIIQIYDKNNQQILCDIDQGDGSTINITIVIPDATTVSTGDYYAVIIG